MGQIEEIDDDEVENVNTDEKSDGNEKIDFTKPCPKDFLPEDFNDYSDVSNERSDIEEETNFFENEGCNCKGNDDNMTSKRVILFIMLFPLVVSAGYMIYDAAASKMPPLFWKFSLIATAVLLAIPMVKSFGFSFLKIVLVCLAAMILLPTYQVYTCSPIELRNDMIGTWFSLKTDAPTFLSKTYASNKCMKKFYFSMPYSLSLLPVEVKIKADIDNLVVHQRDSNNEKAYLLMSKRSVKKKFHKLHLLVKVAGDEIHEKIERALSMDTKQRERFLLLFSGYIHPLGDGDFQLREEIEKSDIVIRPIVYQPTSLQFTDRYVKLNNPNLNY